MTVDFRVRLPADRRPEAERAAALAALGESRYDEVLGVGTGLHLGVAELYETMSSNGVDHAVVHAEFEHGDHADALSEAVAGLVAEDPSRFSGFGTVTLGGSDVSRMVRQVRQCAGLGLVGLNLQPAFFGCAIDDRELYPVYAAAEEAGLVVALHTGVNYERACPMDAEHPRRVDRVAAAFPGLRIVACHAAWPWADELAAVARRHPTVHFDFGGLAPRYLGEPDTGWAVLMRLVDSLLREQALFATDWPVFDPARALGEWAALDIKDITREAVLDSNARRLLGIQAS